MVVVAPLVVLGGSRCAQQAAAAAADGGAINFKAFRRKLLPAVRASVVVPLADFKPAEDADAQAYLQ